MSMYENCVKILTSKEKFHIELGLGRISKILQLFDNPQNKIKTIHIAGTNGKGSTCAIINSILVESGLKIGLFTSPHLEKYNERIKINSTPISDIDLYKLLLEVNEVSEQNDIYLTEFEIITVVGFLYFAREGVDIAVVEVGLGGRLDATNVIQPIMTAITSISLDHTDRLGNTIEKIAAEKAGIIKSNVSCCVVETNNGIKKIEEVSKIKNVELVKVPIDIEIKNINKKNYVLIDNELCEFNLLGKYQAENLALSLGIINELVKMGYNITKPSIKNGLKYVQHNGRFQFIEDLNLIVDGAHNPDGAKVLRKSLDDLFPLSSFNFIYSSINTKDYKTIISTLLTPKDNISFLEFSHQNAVTFKELVRTTFPKSLIIKKTELKDIILKNKQKGEITVITGSLYAIGEVYSIIKIAQLGNIQ